jgi:hypothetical protein
LAEACKLIVGQAIRGGVYQCTQFAACGAEKWVGRETYDLLKNFARLRGPRAERNREHLLEQILLIAIAAAPG